MKPTRRRSTPVESRLKIKDDVSKEKEDVEKMMESTITTAA